MIGGPRGPIVTGLVLAVLVASLVALQVWRDGMYGEPTSGATVLYLRSGIAVSRASLSYAALVADVYWVRAVQYYGGQRLSRSKTKNYDQLYPLLDITTTLDPQFSVAYRFGSIFLAEPFPGGAGRPEQAIALLEKGFRANPKRWQYLQDIGFVHYWWLNDFKRAGAWFNRAADVPGAPWWLRSLAAVTKTQGGDRAGSRMLWQSLHDTSQDEWVRNNAVLRLAQLDTLDAIDRLTGLLRRYAEKEGRPARTWNDLIAGGWLRSVPFDPSGSAFVIDPDGASVRLAPESTLNPLPVGASAAGPAR